MRQSDTAGTSRWSLLAAYLPGQRRRMITLAVVLIGATGLQVINPQIVRYYIDTATASGLIEVLVLAAAAYLTVAVVLQVFKVAAASLGENAAWSMTNQLRVDLADHCVRQDVRFHNERSPGELVERVDGDVTTLATFMSTALLVILSNLLLVFGVFVSLFLTDWRIGLVLLVYAGCAVGVLLAVREIATRSWNMAREASSSLAGFVAERLAGTEDIRSNRAENHVLGRLSRLNDDMVVWHRRARVRSSLIFVCLHGLYLLGYGGALAVGAYLYTRDLASIGTVYLIVAYTNAVYMPLNEVRTQVQELQRAHAGADRVNELFRTTSVLPDGPGAQFTPGAASVEFDRVSFRYAPDGPEVLRDVTFQLPAGATMAVLGRTGSGKTTIARLLVRLYDPVHGTVRLEGKDIREARLDQLRDRIGVVTQDVQVFEGTVRDNLTLFDESVDDRRLLDVLDRLDLGEWLAALPDGLDTVLAAGGSKMSAGEAQLLGVARVLLRDPALVILDEASSRLDPATERMLESALDILVRDRTAIVIAHRMATVSRAGQVLVLDNGRVAESGTRDELLADPGSRLSAMVLAGNRERAT
jgi:ATP-binding cassette subfamily B protein